MERTPSPVHIPAVPTGDDNTRLAVDEAGVVIGDRTGPLIAEDAPPQAPRPCRCIRRIATAQGALVLATPIRGHTSTLRSRCAIPCARVLRRRGPCRQCRVPGTDHRVTDTSCLR